MRRHGPARDAARYANRAVDATIDAEVLAASLQGCELGSARALAGQRALGICNLVHRTA